MSELRSRASVWNEINQALYADLLAGDTFLKIKPLLAHYTTIQAFESMLDSGEMWFGNPLYMNDIEEVRWGIIEGCKIYEAHEQIRDAVPNEEQHQYFRTCLKDCFDNFSVNHVFDTYVLCLSEHPAGDEDGLLSMWRGYGDGGKGVALVFDGREMEDVQDSPLIIARVEYLTTQERYDWFDKQAREFANLVVQHSYEGEELRFAAEALFGRLRMASLFSKHRGFIEEREWRIAYLPERDSNGRLRPFRGYHNGPKGIEPKLKLKVGPMPGVIGSSVLSFDALLHTILLGPSLQAPLPVQSVKRMLELKQRTLLVDRVKASRIPFRPAGIQF